MTLTNEWMSADSWAALAAGGPELDYGMRWGATRSVRVSYAPHPHADRLDRGLLYAYDAATDRYQILAADIRGVDVEVAWQRLIARRDALADLSALTRLLPANKPELVL